MDADLRQLVLACLVICPVPAFASAPGFSGLNLSIDCPGGRPMSIVSTVRPKIYAVIVNFLSKAEARQYVSNTEIRSGEVIDPIYAADQRVVVEWHSAAGAFERTAVAVPGGVAVHAGEGVFFIPGHGDPNNLCLFIPNLIVP